MRARRRVLSNGLVAIAAVGGVALTGCSPRALPSGAGKAAAPPGALWLSRLAGPGHVDDKASAVAVSPGGTIVFVTGTFGFDPLPSPREDYGTVGYDATTGRQLWVSRYDGIGGADLAAAVAVSPDAQTVFVTGESDGPSKDRGKTNAYATVAYNAATGRQLWASRYDGHGTLDNFDFARAIAVSPDGRTVFVTGQGAGKSSLSGYTTVAYSAATGKQEWVRKYNGEGASALAISPDGRTLFVTGDASRKPYGVAYGTIAYDARTGAQRWVRISAGPAGNTTATAVQVSPDGRTVFVTGMTDDHFETVAYSAANGAQRWASSWKYASISQGAATAIAVSPDGGAFYVTGYAGTTIYGNRRPLIVTVGYSARTGAQQWVRQYHAPRTCRNIATTVAVGAGGRTVFVGGYSTIAEPKGGRPCDAGLDTIAYRASTGKQLWLHRVPAAAASGGGGLAVSRLTDTVVITGGVYPRPRAGEQYATVAYRG